MRSRSTHSRRPRHRADDFYGPLDAVDDVMSGLVGGLLDVGQYGLETVTESTFFYAKHQARRLGRAIKQRLGDR